MNPGGMLILSEKTENSGYALEQYHLYKERQGVSREDIEAKAASLKGVMFPESVETHLSRLRRLGFQEVYIASANWCFTTFVAIK
jgi:tRNA (cmo5U34)-methyltransferase